MGEDFTRQQSSSGQSLGIILKGTAMVPKRVQGQSSRDPRGYQEGNDDGSNVGPTMNQDEPTNDPMLDPFAIWVGARMAGIHPRIHV